MELWSAYICDNPEEPGVRCLRMEESRSPAILLVDYVCVRRREGSVVLLKVCSVFAVDVAAPDCGEDAEAL
jgi:hypothetical protein